MKAAVSRVFSGLAPDRPLWRANWALQNNAEIISTDLPWHPTNVKLGGKVSMEGPPAAHPPHTPPLRPHPIPFHKHSGARAPALPGPIFMASQM